MLTWELTGAVIGAGLASGREIASFFSRYGIWSYAGILLSVGMMVFLADAALPQRWLGQWQEKLWQLLTMMLLAATGGAMLSGAGNIAVLTLNVHGAYWFGVVGTLALGWLLAHRTARGLAYVSRGLLIVLAVLILLGYTRPPMKAALLHDESMVVMPLRAVTYGGFNAALQAPIMAISHQTCREKKRSAWLAGGIIAVLLMLGNGVLLKHPALMAEELPFIRMMSDFGKVGYMLGAVSLYLAILSTLTACFRGLGRGILPLVCILAASLLGFSGVVDVVYPLLGGGCCLFLAAAKFTNSCRKAFNSPEDML